MQEISLKCDDNYNNKILLEYKANREGYINQKTINHIHALTQLNERSNNF
jgi:hypothetical protein